MWSTTQGSGQIHGMDDLAGYQAGEAGAVLHENE